mmetsp:Transcript_25323/g.63529  ORF Transcript_25323/g.63529 Transcript_25323/m.63529 type:complete len:226 (-) Transcript_25323:673-1350(-)
MFIIQTAICTEEKEERKSREKIWVMPYSEQRKGMRREKKRTHNNSSSQQQQHSLLSSIRLSLHNRRVHMTTLCSQHVDFRFQSFHLLCLKLDQVDELLAFDAIFVFVCRGVLCNHFALRRVERLLELLLLSSQVSDSLEPLCVPLCHLSEIGGGILDFCLPLLQFACKPALLSPQLLFQLFRCFVHAHPLEHFQVNFLPEFQYLHVESASLQFGKARFSLLLCVE